MEDNIVFYVKEEGKKDIEYDEVDNFYMGKFNECEENLSLDYVYLGVKSSNEDFRLSNHFNQIFISNKDCKCRYDERYPLLQPILKAFVMNKDLVLTDEETKLVKEFHKNNKNLVTLAQNLKDKEKVSFEPSQQSKELNKIFNNMITVGNEDVAQQ